MRRLVITVLPLILVLVIGVLIVRAYLLTLELRIEGIETIVLRVDSSWCICNPYVPIIKDIDLLITIVLYNPTDQIIEVESLEYEVYIEDAYAGNGSVKSLRIPPGRYYLNLTLKPWSIDVLNNISASIEHALRENTESALMSIRMKGQLVAVAKIFNLFRVAEYVKSFSYTKEYAYPLVYPLYTIVRGRVVDASSGLPISGAKIMLVSETTNYTCISNSKGEFLFKKIIPGIYTIMIKKKGYVPYDMSISIGKNEFLLGTIKLRRRY